MNRRGFTLIELVVAVFLTSIVVIAAYSLVTGSTQSFKDQNDRRILEANVRNAELIIQRDFSRIGYHAPFDKVGKELRVKTCAGTSTTETAINALHVTKDGENTKVSFLADLTDYDGFMVKSNTGGTLTFEKNLKLPLSAIDFADHNATPTHQPVDETGFNAIFERAFKHAHAVYILSPTSQGILAKWDHDTQTVTTCSAAKLEEYGFSSAMPFVGDSVYPVLRVNYHVDKNENLLRCYGDPFETSKSFDEDTCEVLLSHVKLFKVYPLTSSNTTANDNCMNSTVINVPLRNVIGLGFCIAAASPIITPSAPTPSEGVQAITAEIVWKRPFWYEEVDGKIVGRAFTHIRGTAVIKNRNEEWSNLGKADNTEGPQVDATETTL